MRTLTMAVLREVSASLARGAEQIVYITDTLEPDGQWSTRHQIDIDPLSKRTYRYRSDAGLNMLVSSPVIGK